MEARLGGAGDVTACAGPVRSLTKTNKMKSQDSKALWATQTEKPIHYTYVIVMVLSVCVNRWKI